MYHFFKILFLLFCFFVVLTQFSPDFRQNLTEYQPRVSVYYPATLAYPHTADSGQIKIFFIFFFFFLFPFLVSSFLFSLFSAFEGKVFLDEGEDVTELLSVTVIYRLACAYRSSESCLFQRVGQLFRPRAHRPFVPCRSNRDPFVTPSQDTLNSSLRRRRCRYPRPTSVKPTAGSLQWFRVP